MFAAPLLLAAVGLLPADSPATDAPAEKIESARWPRFRGPNGEGIAAGVFPDSFTPDDFAWAAPLLGTGVSSPVVWGDAVFVTSADGPRRWLIRLDAATGAIRWTRQAEINPDGPPADPSLHARNDPAAATPAVDENRVFTLFSDGARTVLTAFDHAGERLWQREIGSFEGEHGHGASPIRVDLPADEAAAAGGAKELVVLAHDQNGAGAVLAFDAATGEPVWNVERSSDKAAYAAPTVLSRPGEPLTLITASGGVGLAALDAATGAERWSSGPLPARVVASPVVVGDRAWALCGSGGAGKLLVGVNLQTGAVEVQRTRSLPYVPTPAAADGLLFLWSDRGVVTALDTETGQVEWAQRIGGNFGASPIVVGDKLVGVSMDGVVTVLDASDEFRLRGRSPLGADTQSTPAIAGGRAYFRLDDRLVCLPLKPAGAE
ncbi:MAG: PQQ-binding-like beta-propeller repeat protein [Planctomycetota bacterium]